jgi:hypothetical protein
MAINTTDYEIHNGYNCRAVTTLSFGVVAAVFAFRNFVFIQEIRKIINIANLPNTSGSGDFYCLWTTPYYEQKIEIRIGTLISSIIP